MNPDAFDRCRQLFIDLAVETRSSHDFFRIAELKRDIAAFDFKVQVAAFDSASAAVTFKEDEPVVETRFFNPMRSNY